MIFHQIIYIYTYLYIYIHILYETLYCIYANYFLHTHVHLKIAHIWNAFRNPTKILFISLRISSHIFLYPFVKPNYILNGFWWKNFNDLLGCCPRRFIGETWIYWKSTSNCFADASVTNKWHDLSTSTIRCELKWTEASAGVESQSFALPPVGVVVKPQVLAAMFIPGWISKWLVHWMFTPPNATTSMLQRLAHFSPSTSREFSWSFHRARLQLQWSKQRPLCPDRLDLKRHLRRDR